jgi:sugar O-acyltransferase (sialic acid O-acetyltransferase NeuD family)
MDTHRDILVLGSVGNCADIVDIIHDINRAAGREVYRCVGLLDDDPTRWGTKVMGVEVLGPLASAGEYEDCHFVSGIGSPASYWKREAITRETAIPRARFETIVHPSASVSRTAQIGRGSVVFPNVTITSGVRIGDHVMILPNSVISHDVVVGDFTCITGGVCISGGAEIGRSCYLGTNCAIIGDVRVGDLAMVGMGSVVLADVEPGVAVVGNPARLLRAVPAT